MIKKMFFEVILFASCSAALGMDPVEYKVSFEKKDPNNSLHGTSAVAYLSFWTTAISNYDNGKYESMLYLRDEKWPQEAVVAEYRWDRSRIHDVQLLCKAVRE